MNVVGSYRLLGSTSFQNCRSPITVTLCPLLASRRLKYLGALGPRRRTEALLAAIPGAMDRIYAPIGLDIGAQSPETIALSILAEIQAVLTGRGGPSLRDRDGPIYLREQIAYNEPACPELA